MMMMTMMMMMMIMMIMISDACPYTYRTWEWLPGARIRSFIHPLIIAVLYKVLQVSRIIVVGVQEEQALYPLDDTAHRPRQQICNSLRTVDDAGKQSIHHEHSIFLYRYITTANPHHLSLPTRLSSQPLQTYTSIV